MNKYIKIITCACLLTVSNACDDSFLDEKVLDKYAPSSLNDKLGFEAAVTGIHQHLATHFKSTNDQTLIGMWQVGTDIVWAPAGRSNGDARPYFDYAQLTASDNASLKVWRYLYKLISNANILIQGSGKEVAGMTEAERNVYNAEARFFRAYAYEMLVTLYGDVPLVTEPLTAPKTDFVRATVADVNAVIEEDLLFAVANLPNIGLASKGGRANKAMARQLLATTYLRMGENANAEAQCDEIINGNSGPLSLITARYGVRASQPGDPFSDMFLLGNQRRSQGNTEAIWVLENENPTDKPYGTDSPQQRRVWGGGYYDIAGMLPADTLGGRSIARVRLNNWVLYGLYEDGDMRNSKYNIRRNWYFNNTAANYNNIRGQEVPYGVDTEFTLADGTTKIKILAADTVWRLAPYTTKWGQFDARDTFGYGMWKDFMLMRLGETYLLRAEARFKQNDLGGAADDINVLRDRANASQVVSGEVTLDLILDERARELLAEENRRMTLVRTGTLVQRATTLTGVGPLANGNIETTNGLTSQHLLMPIPQLEIDLNKDAELEQNQDY
jgi:starch-binding outer membrane protein, SusD/RagB family